MRITLGRNFFKKTIIETTIPLNKLPSLSCSTKSPRWYCTDFCKYISSMTSTHSLNTVYFTRRNLATFSESTSPDVNLFKTLNGGSDSSFRRSLYVWHGLYRNINANLIKILDSRGLWYWILSSSFKVTLHSSSFCFIYDKKFSSMLNLVRLQFCPWRNHSRSGITCSS